MAMTSLTVFAITMICEELKHPSATGDGMTVGKTAALVAYFGAIHTSTGSTLQSSGASSITKVRAPPIWSKDGTMA